MANYKIEQIPLVAAICNEICRQHDPIKISAQNDIMNACIEAANLVVNRMNGREIVPVKMAREK